MTPLAPHEAPDAPSVAVEVVLLRHDPSEGFAYRRLITALGRGVSPDHAARGLALLGEHDETHLVHSTSWRATREGGITLTYLVHPDPAPDQPGTPLPEPHRIACSPRPGHPSPPDLEVGHVVAHAVRHLAFLEGSDSAIAAHLSAWPGLVHALRSLPLAAAGEMAHA
ncbi:hypothetical protein J7E90_31755 [Streptomyces sp. ISL-111]|uniref:hypothetical protein n=1 Tax=Streptomyces sp. ISL-111 TaxID=2819175 RepID=UPI001BEC00A0|nr:hypothetical protein [Streptomyces sp. ISL-111]MBT2381741.1 hypothetical protein [Streptomyces sp. ISL-111]